MRDPATITASASTRKAVATPIELEPGQPLHTISEPFFFSYVRDQLIAQYGANRVRSGRPARLHDDRPPLPASGGRGRSASTLTEPTDPASAIVAINPRNGAIRAMVSVAAGHAESQFNLAAQGRRQAGSAFKTFVLTEAIRRGINPDTTIYVSAPFTWQPDPNVEPWTPKTYDGVYYGASTLTAATLRSDNSVYARLTLDLGPESVASRRARDGDPLATGAGGLDRARVERRLGARHGLRVCDARRGRGLLTSRWRSARSSFRAARSTPGVAGGRLSASRVMPTCGRLRGDAHPRAEHALSGTGTRAYFGRPAAGKTGTTDDHTDAWFVGIRRRSPPPSGSATRTPPSRCRASTASRSPAARSRPRSGTCSSQRPSSGRRSPTCPPGRAGRLEAMGRRVPALRRHIARRRPRRPRRTRDDETEPATPADGSDDPGAASDRPPAAGGASSGGDAAAGGAAEASTPPPTVTVN